MWRDKNGYFEYLEAMQEELLESDLEKLEKRYYNLCFELAGKEQAESIKKISLEDFKYKLIARLIKAVEIADENSAKAIYYEYDMDNGWNGDFYICDHYNLLEEEDDDWACDYSEQIEGPSLIRFSEIYLENGFDTTDKAMGSTLYLIARTVCAFAKVLENTSCEVPVCIAFHDQDPIMRIKE